MNIAIIGSGNVGTALAASIGRAGHSVVHTNRGTDAIQTAARNAEIIIIAVPFAASGKDCATRLAPVVAGKVIIDTTNPMTADHSGLATESGSAAQDFAAWLPRAHELEAIAFLNITLQMQPTGTWRTAFGLIDPPQGATAVA